MSEIVRVLELKIQVSQKIQNFGLKNGRKPPHW
jgi:hypothetical protein